MQKKIRAANCMSVFLGEGVRYSYTRSLRLILQNALLVALFVGLENPFEDVDGDYRQNDDEWHGFSYQPAGGNDRSGAEMLLAVISHTPLVLSFQTMVRLFGPNWCKVCPKSFAS
jgi:hypothetical protein